MQVKELKCSHISRLESGILVIRYKPDYEVELEDVKEVEETMIVMSNGANIYCLMDTSGRFNAYSKEAQKFLASEASIVKEKKIKCSAMVIDNLPNRLLTKFFIQFFKPSFDMRIFANHDSAIQWLESEMV